MAQECWCSRAGARRRDRRKYRRRPAVGVDDPEPGRRPARAVVGPARCRRSASAFAGVRQRLYDRAQSADRRLTSISRRRRRRGSQHSVAKRCSKSRIQQVHPTPRGARRSWRVFRRSPWRCGGTSRRKAARVSLLYLVGALEPPTRGTITLADRTVASVRRRLLASAIAKSDSSSRSLLVSAVSVRTCQPTLDCQES